MTAVHLGGAHHDGSELYLPIATPDVGQQVPVRIQVPAGSGIGAVHVRTVADGEPRFFPTRPDGGDGVTDWYVAEFPMVNPDTRYRFLLDRGPAGYTWLNGTGEHCRDVADHHDFRVTAHDPGPEWALDSVVYQIFPDRFARSGAGRDLPAWALPAEWSDPVIHLGPDTPRQFYGGDLPGIVDHLDHIQRLGADTVYLTPIFPARSNHRYDAADFDRVDPLLGGDAALARLTAAAHARGMRVIGDLTTNHTGDGHRWFRAARADPEAVERDYYYLGPDGDYASWLGVPSLPKLNFGSDALRRAMFGADDAVVARWLRQPYELDGWRIDVANMTGRHGRDDYNAEVARQLRERIGRLRPGALLIAEHAHDATADLDGSGWQGTMNYAGFTRPVWSFLSSPSSGLDFLGMPVRVPRRGGAAMLATMRDFSAAIPWKVAQRNWNLLGSHDTPRIVTVTGSAELVRVGAGLLATCPGTPMIFAGDEIGLAGVDGEDARRPMPWHQPERWDRMTQAAFAELFALRRAHRALRVGSFRPVLAAAEAVGFLRETATERLLVLASRGPWSGAVLPAGVLGDEPPVNLYGGMELARTGGRAVVTGEGPTVQIWRVG